MERRNNLFGCAMAILLSLWLCPTLSIADNRFYIPDFTMEPGETKDVSIMFDNTDQLSAFQADIVLPSALSIVQQYDEVAEVDVLFMLSSRKSSDHNLLCVDKGNGVYRLLTNSLMGIYFKGSSGALVTFKVKASESFSGTTSIKLTDVTFSDPTTKGYPVAEEVCNVEITEVGGGDEDVFVPLVSSQPLGGNEDYTHLFDGTMDTKWGFNGTGEDWVIFRSIPGLVANSYRVGSANDCARYWGRTPRNWKVYGSKSTTEPSADSPTWEEIASVTDDQYLKDYDNYSALYSLDVKGQVYNYYKWVILGKTDFCQVGEFAILPREIETVKTLEVLQGPTYEEGIEDYHKDEISKFAFDGDINTKWGFQGNEGRDIAVLFYPINKVHATGYSITACCDVERYTGRAPKSWILYGAYNTSGIQFEDLSDNSGWEVISEITNDTKMQDVNNEEYVYALDKADAYDYYKWVIHATPDTYNNIGEFRILGNPVSDETIPVSAIELAATSVQLEIGKIFGLEATVTPDNATNKAITYSSSNTGVATVSADGEVTAVAAGNAVITATAADGSQVSATCNITVAAPHIHNFSTTDNGNGTHTTACAGCDFSETTDHTFVDGICTGCGAKEQSEPDKDPDTNPDTDITAFDNVIYLNPVVAHAGSPVTLCFSLKNKSEIQTIGVYVALPEGMRVAEDEYGQIIELAVDRLTTIDRNGNKSHTLSSSFIDENLRVGILGNAGKAFIGNDGPLFTMEVNVGDMEEGVYNVILSEMTLTDTSDNTVNIKRVAYPITVMKYMPGDANGDGSINMADANMVVNRFLGKPTPSIQESAADVNGDGSVNMADANAIVNIFLGKK